MLGNMLKCIPNNTNTLTQGLYSIPYAISNTLKKKNTCHGFDHPDKTTDPGIATGW